jgi:hypothetical protein
MNNHVLLDAFADARRSWDEVVSLQPDIYAGSGNLKGLDLAELSRRVEAHQAAVDALAEALQTEPTPGRRSPRTGISNRVSPEEETEERRAYPALNTGSPPPQDAAGRVGERPLTDDRDRHTSHKAGSRSVAQKESGSRYPDRSTPSARKVGGAFGRERKR